MDDVKTGFRWHVPGRARLWGKGHGKVNQREWPIMAHPVAQIAIVRNP
jgi:hypothetical protein